MQDSQIAVLIDSHGCELKYTFELPKNIRLFYRTESGTTAPALSNNDVFSFFQMFGITPDNNIWLKKQKKKKKRRFCILCRKYQSRRWVRKYRSSGYDIYW
jgi:hypothetical protein